MQELKVPSVGESIVEVEIGAWLKGEGESFAQDEPLVELITDKATLELPAPFAGTLKQILKRTGETPFSCMRRSAAGGSLRRT